MHIIYNYNININVYNIKYKNITATEDVSRKGGKWIKINLSFQMGSSPFSVKQLKHLFTKVHQYLP